jgi:hypothetical protein
MGPQEDVEAPVWKHVVVDHRHPQIAERLRSIRSALTVVEPAQTCWPGRFLGTGADLTNTAGICNYSWRENARGNIVLWLHLNTYRSPEQFSPLQQSSFRSQLKAILVVTCGAREGFDSAPITIGQPRSVPVFFVAEPLHRVEPEGIGNAILALEDTLKSSESDEVFASANWDSNPRVAYLLNVRRDDPALLFFLWLLVNAGSPAAARLLIQPGLGAVAKLAGNPPDWEKAQLTSMKAGPFPRDLRAKWADERHRKQRPLEAEWLDTTARPELEAWFDDRRKQALFWGISECQWLAERNKAWCEADRWARENLLR